MHSHADRQSQGKAGDRLTTTSAAGETTSAEELGEMHRQPSLDTTLSVCIRTDWLLCMQYWKQRRATDALTSDTFSGWQCIL